MQANGFIRVDLSLLTFSSALHAAKKAKLERRWWVGGKQP